MIREGRTMRARAATALASALVLLGSIPTAALAADNGDNNRKLDTSSGLTPDMNDPSDRGRPRLRRLPWHGPELLPQLGGQSR